jgi:hypothetical protein
MDGSLITTLFVARLLDDDRGEAFEGRELRDLFLPLLLCNSMGGQQTVQPPGGPATTVSTGIDPSTILLFALLGGRRRHSHDKPE